MLECKVPLGEHEFHKNKTKKDGLSTICKICSKLKSKSYYKNNTNNHREKVGERNRRVRKENSIKLYDYLSKNPCVNCGERDITVLEFDHLKDKIKDVSRMVSDCSWETVQKEIEKCQVLCANCHRRKTATDQNWFVLDYLKNKNGRLA